MRISDWSSDVCSSDLRRWIPLRLLRFSPCLSFALPFRRCRLSSILSSRQRFKSGVEPVLLAEQLLLLVQIILRRACPKPFGGFVQRRVHCFKRRQHIQNGTTLDRKSTRLNSSH